MMSKWVWFGAYLLFAGYGWYNVLTVKRGTEERGSPRRYAIDYLRGGSWILAIGGSILALKVLLIILQENGMIPEGWSIN
jgi:hypothetical protein